MERKKLEREHNEQVAVVANPQNVQPINPVRVETEVVTNFNNALDNEILEDNQTLEVKRPTIIFTDPDEGQE